MKEFLQGLIEKRRNEINELQTRSDASNDVVEVRGITEQIKNIGEELRTLETQLVKLNEPGKPVDSRGFNPLATYGQRGAVATSTDNTELDKLDTIQYRSAFMNFVCRNIPIPTELRESEVTLTTDASAVIPTTILQEIIRELKTRGSIWAKVRKLNVQGGIQIPIASLKPKAVWVNENKATDSQKLESNDKVSFNYYGLECKVSQSLLVNVTTLSMFQELFPQLASEAIIDAIEVGVFTGTGNGQMLGILNDTRIDSTKKIPLSEDQIGDWQSWKKLFFAKIKLAYATGEIYMAKGTFDSYIDGMVDKNGQPISRVNYGLTDEAPLRFNGKNVCEVEDDIIKPYDEASEGDVIGVFVNLNDYGVNTNMQMKVAKWEDKDTHEIKNNCMLILDGKMIDVNGILILTKGAKITA